MIRVGLFGPEKPPLGQGRRPRLRVLAGSAALHQHSYPFAIGHAGQQHSFLACVLTFGEWDALLPAERPIKGALLPGVGFIWMEPCTAEEFDTAMHDHSEAYSTEPYYVRQR